MEQWIDVAAIHVMLFLEPGNRRISIEYRNWTPLCTYVLSTQVV